MFQRASKTKTKLRAALFGPSGSGKTFTALRVATGMGGKIAVIDSEHGSASKYSDRFEFDVENIEDKSIFGYSTKIFEAGQAGYNILIIDSLSHAWQQLLTQIDELAKTKYKGNTWSAWNEGTPQQRRLVESILSYSGHILVTMRSKTAWEVQKSDSGKIKPVRLGLEPEQGKGIEYEFDLLIELNSEHYATVIKDRTGKFQDMFIEKPGEEFGKQLMDWLNDGEIPTLKPIAKTRGWNDFSQKERIDYTLAKLNAANDAEEIKNIRDKIIAFDFIEEDKVTLLNHVAKLLYQKENIAGIVTDGHHSKIKEN